MVLAADDDLLTTTFVFFLFNNDNFNTFPKSFKPNKVKFSWKK